MYADRITGSMERAIRETDRRRAKQMAYNEEHGITPETVKKNVEDILAGVYKGDVDMNRVTAKVDKPLVGANLQAHLDGLRDQMRKAAENLEFEEAARLRDEIKRLEAVELAVADDPLARQSAVEAAVPQSRTARRRRAVYGGAAGAARGECEAARRHQTPATRVGRDLSRHPSPMLSSGHHPNPETLPMRLLPVLLLLPAPPSPTTAPSACSPCSPPISPPMAPTPR
jgi:hypothetical protein